MNKINNRTDCNGNDDDDYYCLGISFMTQKDKFVPTQKYLLILYVYYVPTKAIKWTVITRWEDTYIYIIIYGKIVSASNNIVSSVMLSHNMYVILYLFWKSYYYIKREEKKEECKVNRMKSI